MTEIHATTLNGEDGMTMVQEAMRHGLCEHGIEDPDTGIITLEIDDDEIDPTDALTKLKEIGFRIVKDRSFFRRLISFVLRR